MTANACFMATVHLLTSAQKMFVFTSVFITAFHPARGSCPGQGGKRKCGTPSATDRKSPKPRRRNVAKRTLSKNRIQDLVQRRRKAKPRLRKKCGQCSPCRSADSWVNLNKSYLSMYHNLFFLCEKQVHSEHVFI